jgi:CRP-like cAMP-binding protein
MNTEEIIAKVELFSALSPKHRKQVAGLCKVRSFNAGDYIVRQGEEGLGLFIITKGKVRVEKEISGGSAIEIASHGPGEFIGEMSVLDGAVRTANVIAATDCECLVLLSWDFNSLMKSHPEIALEILPVLVRRFRETNEKLLTMQL